MTVEEAVGRITGPRASADMEPGDPEAVYREVIRWRRSAVDPETADDIRRKIGQARANGTALEFAVPFGGYKAWHQSSSPHINWAEVMWLDHLRRFGTAVNARFGDGVIISLSYYSAALDIINNLPDADQHIYINELQQVARHMSTASVRIEIVDLVDMHGTTEQFRADLLNAIATQGVPDEAHLHSARRNLRPVGVTDLGSDWEAAVVRSAAACTAMESLAQRRQFNKFGPRIQITHIRGPALSLHLGSTRSSTLQPWVGSGLLVHRPTGDLIESVRTSLAGTESVPVSHPLDTMVGLQQIAVSRR